MAQQANATGSSRIVKNVTIDGRRTSIKLEPTEAAALARICDELGLSVHEFCARAEFERRGRESSRTGRIRMAILDFFLQTPVAGRTNRPGGPRAGVQRTMNNSPGSVRNEISVDRTTAAATSPGVRS